ncbi:hypothetical protein [Bosea lathyri]|uniref:Uncharacterized protein n=1 Tax=Bosea lathyri TaxID=1036778 RepID=A0A1H6DAP3_9HYPH|nr:hypothetical protein [Bosea lathyri]SEG82252.1 hypothetical protein SAMN04488115_12022 [Bosea lathyri]
MQIQLPDEIQREVEIAIRSKASQSLVVDVYATAEQIRRRHAMPETGLNALAATVARLAAQCGCAVELDGMHSNDQIKQSA